MRVEPHSGLVVATFVVSLASCALVTPLDDIEPTSNADSGPASVPPDAGPDCSSADAQGCHKPVRSETCSTTDDGQCDEPSGTNTCASGTDTKDCRCAPRLWNATCDPIAQCGCDQNSTCVAIPPKGVNAATASCVRAGSGGQKSACKTSSDCERGLFCHDSLRVCARYCADALGCEDGACIPLFNPSDTSVAACGIGCDRMTGEPCPSGAACAQLDRTRTSAGAYCAVPLHEACPHDGICDEPSGTGLCALGFDRADCCKPPSVDGECEPVSQCGCEDLPGTQCQNVPSSIQTVCVAVGTKTPGEMCTFWKQQCSPGHVCESGACRRYCSDNSGCGDGNFCLPARDNAGEELKGIGACYVACDFSDPQACAPGLACARTAENRTYCMVPFSPCPASWINNGRCDDTRPGGTRFCAMGADPDCS